MIEGDGPDENSVTRYVWRFFLSIISSFWMMYVALLYGMAFNAPAHVGAILFLGIILSGAGWFIGTILHEAGHALTALTVGWRPIVFVARPFAFRLIGPSFAWMPRALRRHAAGWVSAIPRDGGRLNRGAFAVFVLGGPMASATVALAGWAGATWSAGQSSQMLWGAIGLQGLFSAVINLLPATRIDQLTDGDHLRRLLRDTSGPSSWRAFELVATLGAHDVRLRDYPAWLVAEARIRADPAILNYLDTIEIGMALDAERVDVAEARRLLDAFLEAHGDSPWRASCDAYLAAIWEGDLERAQQATWTGGFDQAIAPMILAARAAVAARRGDGAATREALAAMWRDRRQQTQFRDDIYLGITRQVERVLHATVPDTAAMPVPR